MTTATLDAPASLDFDLDTEGVSLLPVSELEQLEWESSCPPHCAEIETSDDGRDVLASADCAAGLTDGRDDSAEAQPGGPPTSAAAAGVGEVAVGSGGGGAAEGDGLTVENSSFVGTGPAEENFESKISDGENFAAVRNEKISAFVTRRAELMEKVDSLRTQVAAESIVVLRLKEQHKSAKDALKDSTEELNGAERELDGVEQAWSDGSWLELIDQQVTSEMAAAAAAARGKGSDAGAEKRTITRADRPPTDQSSTNISQQSPTSLNSVDPATTTPLSALGLSKGRLESIEATPIPGGGRLCTTVADLEALYRADAVQHIKGFGPKTVDTVTDALAQWRKANPMPAAVVERVAPVELVDGKWDPVQFRAGQIAYADGKQPGENPNSLGGFMRESWEAGWTAKQTEESRIPDQVPSQQEQLADPIPEQPATAEGDARTEPESATGIPAESEGGDPPAAEKPRKPRAPRKRGGPHPGPAKHGGPTPANDSSDSDDVDPELTAAYTAGCEAGAVDKPVTDNPNTRGTQLWKAWDQGWQETNTGGELL